MSFFKKLFGKGAEPITPDETFTPNPTQDVPGLNPLVVQVGETLFTNPVDLRVVFKKLPTITKIGPAKDIVTLHLNILYFSEGNLYKFSNLLTDIFDYDPYRDIWRPKAMKEWAIRVIKEGKFVYPSR